MSFPARIITITALVALSFASFGCQKAAVTPKLDGTEWSLTAWSASSASPTAYPVTLTFADNTMGGTAQVNSYGGSYQVAEGGALTLGEVARTLMAGPDDAMHAEDLYFELLARAARVAVDGDTLTLSDGNGNELLIYTRAK